MLASSEQSLTDIVGLSPLAVYELTAEGRVRLWNHGAERMFGWTEEELLGRTNPTVPSENLLEDKGDLAQLLAGSAVNAKNVRRLHRDGRYLEARLWAVPTHNSHHEITGIVATVAEISLHKSNEEMQSQLYRSEERMRLALDAAKIGWWDWNLKTGEMIWSGTACRQLGLPEGSPASFDLFMSLVSADDRKTVEDALESALRHDLPQEVKHRVFWPDGSMHWRSVVGQVFRDESGNPARILGLGRDIDDEKATDNRLMLQAAALQATANSIVITDDQGTILWTNPAFSQLTGYRFDEALGKNPSLLKSGLQGDSYYQTMWAEIRSGKTWRGELVNRRKDGSLYTEEMTITPVRIGGEEITNYIAVKQDISLRKIAEDKLRKAERKYRLIFEDAPIGIFQVTPEGRPVSINRALATMHGYDSPEQLLAEVPNVGSKLFADESLLRSFGEVLARDGAMHDTEFEVRNKNGGSKWVLANVRAITDADGKVMLHEGTVTDITDRKHAEGLLRERAVLQEQLSTIIEMVPGAVYSFLTRPDGSTAMPFASARLAEIFGLSAETIETDGSPLLEMVHPEDRKGVEDSIWDSFRGLTPWRHEFRVNHPERGQVWVEATSSPEAQPDGSVLWHGFMLDVTERKRLEAQLLQAHKMECVGRLAGGIAHDFNNMMTVVLGYSDVIAESLPPDDPSRLRLAKIKDAAQRATALTRQLLAFSRLQPRFPAVMNLTAHITQFATILPRLLGEDIQILLSLDENLWSVNADASQVDQILMNLAVNARDAMPRGGTLRIETSNVELTDSEAAKNPGMRPGEFVMIRVSDTGVGISPTTMPKIFEPFFTTKVMGKGTGLGLSTTYGVVKQNGGFIGVRSEEGSGATFEVYLPHDCNSPKIDPPSESLRPQSAPSKTILLVEDEAALREITSLILKKLGYTVLAAGNGREAVRIAEERSSAVDLLLTDVVMPEMNGWELAERLRRTIPSLKVLFASGYSDGEVVREGRLPPGGYFLQKPLTKLDLEDKLRGIFQT